MAPELFVDTSAWYPLVDTAHPDHESLAGTLRERIAEGAVVVITNLVLAESHALIMRRIGREAALTFLDGARAQPNVVVYSDRELEQKACTDWLDRFEDQRFSLTDAVSFAVMAERGIAEALALDRHFSTAGFQRVGARGADPGC